jgi:hypothetical protein
MAGLGYVLLVVGGTFAFGAVLGLIWREGSGLSGDGGLAPIFHWGGAAAVVGLILIFAGIFSDY